MNKTELIHGVWENQTDGKENLNKAQIAKIINATLARIKKGVRYDGVVDLQDFGKFTKVLITKDRGVYYITKVEFTPKEQFTKELQ